MGSLLCSDLQEELVERPTPARDWRVDGKRKMPVHSGHQRFFKEGCGMNA